MQMRKQIKEVQYLMADFANSVISIEWDRIVEWREGRVRSLHHIGLPPVYSRSDAVTAGDEVKKDSRELVNWKLLISDDTRFVLQRRVI